MINFHDPVFDALVPVEPDFSLLGNFPTPYWKKEEMTNAEYVAFLCDKLRNLDPDTFPEISVSDPTTGEEQILQFQLPYLVLVRDESRPADFKRPYGHWSVPLTVENYRYFCAMTMREYPQDVQWKDSDNREYPQTNVSALDGAAFCNWLNTMLGLEPCYEVVGTTEIKILHRSVACSIPTAKVYDAMLGGVNGISAMTEEQLAWYAIHRENSNDYMHKVYEGGTNHPDGILPAYWSKDTYHGVITPDGKWYPEIPEGLNIGIFGPVGNVYSIIAVED